MNWSIGNIIGIGTRLINNRNEIAAVGKKVLGQVNQARGLFEEVRDVVNKVAPDLLRDLNIPGGRAVAIQDHAFDLKWVQQALNHLLHGQLGYQLKVDGIMGEKTRTAITDYQKLRGLEPDGWLGPLTLAALEEDIQKAHAGGSRQSS